MIMMAAAAALSLSTALAFALLGRIGVSVLLVLALGGAVGYGFGGSDNEATMVLMIVGYGAPIIIAAVAFGLWAGSFWRDGRRAVSALLMLPLAVAAVYFAAEERRRTQAQQRTEDLAYHGQPIPEIPKLPRDAELWMAGAYESKLAARSTAGVNAPRPGDVKLRLPAGRKPLVLVLTNYHPVRWVIDTQGRTIAAVLLSGYYPPTVVGTDAPTVAIGRAVVYQDRGPDYEQLRKRVEALTDRKLRGFVGAYEGLEFVLPVP